MKTAVIGLGLIGGSMAKAFKDNTDSEVYGLDINASVMLKAKLVGAIDGELTDGILAQSIPNQRSNFFRARRT